MNSTVEKAKETLPVGALTSKPAAPKEYTVHIISQWEQAAATNYSQFQQQLTNTILQYYPSEVKTVLDEVLATFILYHPEHVELVLSPLISLIYKNRLAYNKRSAPFYSFLQLFTEFSTFSSAHQQSHRRILQQIVLYLSNNNQVRNCSGNLNDRLLDWKVLHKSSSLGLDCRLGLWIVW